MRRDSDTWTPGEALPPGTTSAEALDLLTLPFDQYQRYSTVAQVAGTIRAVLSKTRLRVLDVGGFHRTPHGQAMLPLVPFLPSDRTAVIDLADAVLPNYVRASGTALPFSSEAFELVVSCDTLEHVPFPDRPAFLAEILRVASHCVLLMAPFDDEQTLVAEGIVREYLASRNCVHSPLEEHFERGLPSTGTVRALLGEKGLKAIEFADGYLPNWLAMMVVHLAAGVSPTFLAKLNYFYNRHFSADDRREPAYRRVFVIAKPGHEDLLPAISRAVESHRIGRSPSSSFASDMVSVLKQGHSDEQARMAALEAENARLHQVVEGYEQGHFIRFTRQLYSWRQRLRRRSHGR